MAERRNRIGADKYTIEVNEAGEIVLDTGNAVGTVTVKGDLDVLGVTTTVESTEVAIGDKTFTINKNETVGGISDLLDGYNRGAGIIISRGPGSKRTMNLMSIACIIECIAFLSQQQPNLIHPRAKEIMEPDATVKI
jgi:hypothetical protein